MRVLAQISVFGVQDVLDALIKANVIPFGSLKQVGLRRSPPVDDSWLYASPLFSFHFDFDAFDNEIRSFLSEHEKLGDFLSLNHRKIEYAILTICPVQESDDESFACFLSNETVIKLSQLGLALEVAPASVMPEVPYWIFSKTQELGSR